MFHFKRFLALSGTPTILHREARWRAITSAAIPAWARRKGRSLADKLDKIAKRCAALPVLDSRLADEILGYDEHGLPR